ncbi:uncharacterized protein LOC127463486 isoform X4 [Manacus candei]|uniref:uncharacterized protein LOC127463486 isoform X2 n=1 Tax=Manacus candei TaxID=415023 RepID=UPI0022268B5A|nr:uncharacterized protein LOC127463486 isoform X2 [Manacus candei]XP_051628918.1 uncharacterized protein LOC127463486 isoform X3 [Manacus candei]XP_051628919.1 uncharacterized protein LOC127463486 isoform X4 [Manacus candei]
MGSKSSVLAPFVWEESSSVFNSGTWTGNFSAGLLQANNSPFSQARKCLPSGSQVQLVGQPGQSMGSKSSLCWHLWSGRNPRLYSILGLGLAISVQDSCKRTTALSPRQESAYPQGLRCSWWASQGSPWAARALCAGTFGLGGILVCIQFWDLDWQFQCRTPASEQQPFLPGKKVLTLRVSGAVGGPARAVHGQQELSVLAPLVWEESSSVFNSGTWTGNFSAGLLQANNSPFSQARKCLPSGSQVQLVGQPGQSMGSKSSLCWHLWSGRNPRLYSILGLGLAISVQDSCKRTTALSPRCSWWAGLDTRWAARALCAVTFSLGGIFVRMEFWELDCPFRQ